MSSLRNILKDDTSTDSNSNTRSDGLSGQGSHFKSYDSEPTYAPTADTTGGTLTTANPQTAGPADVSAVSAPSRQAGGTVGPEAGGSQHIGTIPSGGAQYSQGQDTSPSSGMIPTTPMQSQSSTITSSIVPPYNNADTSSTNDSQLPSSANANESGGTAAVGQTETYASYQLVQGDPLSSIVDRESQDPLTYKMPEASHGG